MTLMTSKHSEAARVLGSATSEKKAIASRTNGTLGGYWKQKRNRATPIFGLNKKYEKK